MRPADTRIPTASSTIDPGTLITHLTWVPFLGTGEFRDGPYSVVLDFIHVPVKSGVNTPILFSGATTGLTEDAGTAVILYRPFVDPDQSVDVGLGVRAWGLAGDIALNQGLAPAVNVSHGLSWADPLLAVRYHRDLGNGFSATAYGDIGGFGVGAHIDWQLLGTIDYALNSWIDPARRDPQHQLQFRRRARRFSRAHLRPDPGRDFPLLTATTILERAFHEPRRVKAVDAGGVAAGDLGLFVVRHAGEDLR